jgi:hypothetical protein
MDKSQSRLSLADTQEQRAQSAWNLSRLCRDLASQGLYQFARSLEFLWFDFYFGKTIKVDELIDDLSITSPPTSSQLLTV